MPMAPPSHLVIAEVIDDEAEEVRGDEGEIAGQEENGGGGRFFERSVEAAEGAEIWMQVGADGQV